MLFYLVRFSILVCMTTSAAFSAEPRAVCAADTWRAPPTKANAARDANLHAYVADQVPEALEHTGAAAFDEHLTGVQSVLRQWGAEEAVCDAGLFHSIYGTEGFQGFKLPLANRPKARLFGRGGVS